MSSEWDWSTCGINARVLKLSMGLYTGTLNLPKDSYFIGRYWFRNPCAKSSCSGYMVTHILGTLEFKRPPTSCNIMHTGQVGGKMWNFFVRRCDQCCRYRKGPTRIQGAMKNGVGLVPFQEFHIDLTGPHRKSSGGHVYLLTGVCCFTKYLIAVPLKDKTALTVANALLKMCI